MWIEPVRDWNCDKFVASFLITYVWIEPVRDWNPMACAKPIRSKMGVNWTCEGLKLTYRAEDLEKAADSVNWTCEGLKRALELLCFLISAMCELNLWGIETCQNIIKIYPITRVNWTCEGLKLIFHSQSLSIRSWCELNLWGIET